MIMVGNSNVGKTALLQRYHKNSFSKNTTPTLGAEFATKKITLRNGTAVQA